jgi:Rho GTPase-activating protein 22/24/25
MKKEEEEIFIIKMNKKKFGEEMGITTPMIITTIIKYIKEKHIKTEGIFRINGDNEVVKLLKKKLNKGESIKLKEIKNIYDLCSLFKLYLKELPDPIINFDNYEVFLSISGIII